MIGTITGAAAGFAFSVMNMYTGIGSHIDKDHAKTQMMTHIAIGAAAGYFFIDR